MDQFDGISFQVKISGVYELVTRMKSLSEKVQKRVLRKALRAGAEKIAEAARLNASMVDDPLTPEDIEANIQARYSPIDSKPFQTMVYRVGVAGGARAGAGGGGPGGDTFYWRFHEFGTSKMRAQPIMRPAAISAAEAAAEEVATVLEQQLDRITKERERIENPGYSAVGLEL